MLCHHIFTITGSSFLSPVLFLSNQLSHSSQQIYMTQSIPRKYWYAFRYVTWCHYLRVLRFQTHSFIHSLFIHSLTHSLARSLTSVISYVLFIEFPKIIYSFITESSQQGHIATVERLHKIFPVFLLAYHNPPTGPISFRSALILSSLLCVSIVIIIVSSHAWCVFSKPCCTKLTLHCNHRSGHLKTEHTESLFLLRRHLRNWPRGPAVSMRSELLVAHEKLGQLPLLTVYVVPV